MTEQLISVGDKVMWRGAWGSEMPQKVTVDSIEVCEHPRGKYGVSVEAAYWSDKERLVLTFKEVNNWAYGFQIEKIKG